LSTERPKRFFASKTDRYVTSAVLHSVLISRRLELSVAVERFEQFEPNEDWPP